MAEPITPGETPAPPADPAVPAATPPEPAAPAATPSPTPNGSETDNNPGSGEPEMVPSGRLREETEKRRKAEDELRQLKESQATPTPEPSQDEEIEPDVEKLLDSYAKKKGLVSQEELKAERSKIQVQEDVKDLTTNPPNPGIPFNDKDVAEYAKEHNLPITSKAAWTAAYREMNYDKIMEAERQKAIDGFKTAGRSGAETPSSPGATPPSEPEIDAKLSGKERTRERIRQARERLSV